jgi:4-cresol dehydrogenase (hydroxylating) flavoprotein subunit
MNTTQLGLALREWATAVGDQHVLPEAAGLVPGHTATFETHSKVVGVLRPANRSEVQECVRIAGRHRIPLYPISTGRNWGYGSAVPVHDAVLLDLSRMNAILEHDEELAFVTVEPGVTQRQLYQFLSQRGSRLWLDATGASPDCSIIGNTLERGFGHTPMGEHSSHVCGFEVVLPTGECVQTGYRRFSPNRSGAVNRWGLGPSLDGLFSQSNFGIVISMTVWLMPRPDYFRAFFFRSGKLGSIVDVLRPLRLNGSLRSVVHIANDYRVLSGLSQYPWTKTAGATPLSPELMADFRRELGIGAWNGSGGLYGSRRHVKEAQVLLERALSHNVDRFFWLDDTRMK